MQADLKVRAMYTFVMGRRWQPPYLDPPQTKVWNQKQLS
jgi:hypothetical protein